MCKKKQADFRKSGTGWTYHRTWCKKHGRTSVKKATPKSVPQGKQHDCAKVHPEYAGTKRDGTAKTGHVRWLMAQTKAA
jgi:hypothetical protein